MRAVTKKSTAMPMESLILATSNVGKIHEFRHLLTPIRCIPQDELGIISIPETKVTFVENALLKARHASHCGNAPALADDSGLVVPALGGEPGIYSARYAGETATTQQNNNLLLEKLRSIPPSQWQAYFYCVLVLVQHPHDPTPIIAYGQVQGLITDHPSGTQGFGYDPVFYLPNYQCTMAELAIATKNTISHRANAFRELKKQLSID